MNQYGRIARRYWARWLPSRLRQIQDPDSYFLTMGREIEDEITARSLQIAGDDPPGETYLDKVGRLNMAWLQAEETVLAERVHLPPEPGTDPDEAQQPDPTPQGSEPAWIPVVEDPSHPFWQQIAEAEQDQTSR